MPKENGCLWKVLDRELRKYDISTKHFNILYETENIVALKESVYNGHGFSFCSDIALKDDLYQNKIQKLTLPDFQVQIPTYMIYDDKHMSTTHKYFIANFKKILEFAGP